MAKSKQPKHKPGIHLFKTKSVYPDLNGQFMWHIVSKNGRIIARSSETYTRKGNAVKSIRAAFKIFKDAQASAGLNLKYYDHSKEGTPIKSYL